MIGRLGRREHDHEDREDLRVEPAAVPAEPDEVDVAGVEHQLDADQDADRVPARDDSHHADAEQRRGESEIVVEPDAHASPLRTR